MLKTMLFLGVMFALSGNVLAWGFDEGGFYQCSSVGCSASALTSLIFANPAIFAGGCTATLITCGIRAIGWPTGGPSSLFQRAELRKEQNQCRDIRTIPLVRYASGLPFLRSRQ